MITAIYQLFTHVGLTLVLPSYVIKLFTSSYYYQLFPVWSPMNENNLYHFNRPAAHEFPVLEWFKNIRNAVRGLFSLPGMWPNEVQQKTLLSIFTTPSPRGLSHLKVAINCHHGHECDARRAVGKHQEEVDPTHAVSKHPVTPEQGVDPQR